ncbi:MAG: Replication factor C small subunit [Methanocella sp. PtaU1.Bin125]|nr:MAG: Replication factor C small subunit [Methanocella sp. PtaU1.Bin125]
MVRGKIKEFARTAPIGGADFKIIFLDEADALTQDAQAALRRTMERFSRNCRFVLSCNYSSKIIEPIQSRCAIFRFRPVKAEDIKHHLQVIARKEGVKIDDAALDAIVPPSFPRIVHCASYIERYGCSGTVIYFLGKIIITSISESNG